MKKTDMFRSSRAEVFCKKGVLKNFANFIYCEFCEIFKNAFFKKTPPVPASVCSNVTIMKMISKSNDTVFNEFKLSRILD